MSTTLLALLHKHRETCRRLAELEAADLDRQIAALERARPRPTTSATPVAGRADGEHEREMLRVMQAESPSPHWRRMWCLKADEFLRSYHRRSNVESAIGAIKARCNGLVRSRTAAAQCNEVLAKVLLHNLACVVHAIEKYGIGVSFPLEVKS
jgi:hypothetical protein